MPAGFFKTFLSDVATVINDRFGADAVLDVKAVRRAMDIPSSDRSKIIFIAKALQALCDAGYLEFVGRNSPKKFKKVKQIPGT